MPIPIIFDTDMDTDCDDVGALAILHHFAKEGKAEILGVVCNVPYSWTATCAQAVNAWYGRSDIPVGILAGMDLETHPQLETYRQMIRNAVPTYVRRYNEPIGRRFLDHNPHTPQPRPALQLYRELLAQQPDHSITIVAVGLLTALHQLLESPADAISPLTGKELVARKVDKLVTMGLGTFPEGGDSFNWEMDRTAAAAVLNDWPGKLVVSELGEHILTGASLSSRLEVEHPLRQAYEIYLNGQGLSRPSWDLVAVLYAVLGEQPYFRERTGYRLHYMPDSGKHVWEQSQDRQDISFEQLLSNDEMAAVLEERLIFSAH